MVWALFYWLLGFSRTVLCHASSTLPYPIRRNFVQEKPGEQNATIDKTIGQIKIPRRLLLLQGASRKPAECTRPHTASRSYPRAEPLLLEKTSALGTCARTPSRLACNTNYFEGLRACSLHGVKNGDPCTWLNEATDRWTDRPGSTNTQKLTAVANALLARGPSNSYTLTIYWYQVHQQAIQPMP